MREQILIRQNALFVEVLTILQIKKKIRKYKEKDRAAGDSYRQLTKNPPQNVLDMNL